jgi:hypothetical protein
MGGVNHKRVAHLREYTSWDSMKARCLNPNHKAYKNYGGAGTIICERWMLFDNFLEDMGERPEGTNLDRIDTFGNYELSNCRWADWLTQQHNRKTHKREDVGILFIKPSNKWEARITTNYKQRSKWFKTKEEAIGWRKEMEKKLWQI